MMPDRVDRVAVLVGLAPRHAEGLDWYAGMTESNRREYTLAESGVLALARVIEALAERIRNDPKQLLRNLRSELPLPDRHVVADSGIKTGLERNYVEALRQHGAGWVDDARSFTQEWGFDPADILVPALLWHGAQDVLSPLAHTQWLARAIRGATERIAENAAHFKALDALIEDALPWLTSSWQHSDADAA
jgi:pimeloyl-ACP methyl ester carboxylesterase